MSNTTVPPKPTKWLLLAIGWVFMVLGVLGLFLPVLQGVLFLLIGLIILSSEYVWAHHLLCRIRKQFPHASRRGHEIAMKTKAWLQRFRTVSRPQESHEKTLSESYDKPATSD